VRCFVQRGHFQICALFPLFGAIRVSSESSSLFFPNTPIFSFVATVVVSEARRTSDFYFWFFFSGFPGEPYRARWSVAEGLLLPLIAYSLRVPFSLLAKTTSIFFFFCPFWADFSPESRWGWGFLAFRTSSGKILSHRTPLQFSLLHRSSGSAPDAPRRRACGCVNWFFFFR